MGVFVGSNRRRGQVHRHFEERCPNGFRSERSEKAGRERPTDSGSFGRRRGRRRDAITIQREGERNPKRQQRGCSEGRAKAGGRSQNNRSRQRRNFRLMFPKINGKTLNSKTEKIE